ncbi:tryptophan-rich sensory protein [Elioraea sp. Yellowstone]|jgi:tryptophan-rich sensory protein|uniref:TspO/MBR family protein n=1 Tax=Elioraea sp. Yellowstone TaxID=2592070 RepID=UPI001153996B|nr:TspO/MBR family protein [Elioraea sp. Yellowstone]TQF77095.1 tryptophan-rich sensory protein [Elioraea sp. Yellowstone]
MAGELAVLGPFLLACFAAATTGAVFRPGPWYDRLDKPSWTPPDWAFPVAWTLLYVAIGVAPWLVWRAAGFAGAALPLAVWAVQLALNAAWSWLFFGLRRMDLAFAEVVALWASIALMIALFLPISVTAGLLMVPYLVWVSFAAALNLAVWQRNKDAVGSREPA